MMKVKFSIQYKVLSLVTGLVLLAIGVHLVMALQTFKKDKTELTFDLNKNAVGALASELDTGLSATIDKLKLYAALANESPQIAVSAFDEILKTDPLLVYVDLKKVEGSGYQKITANTQGSYLSSYSLKDEFFASVLPAARPAPIGDVKVPHFWNATINHGPPLLGVNIEVDGVLASTHKSERFIVTGYIKADVFLKTMIAAGITQTFIVDEHGKLLIHPDPSLLSSSTDFSLNPIVAEFLRSTSSNGVMKYNYKNKGMLGAYHKIGMGSMGVISEVESAKVFDAVNRLSVRTGLFALIVVTLTFIISMLFAQSLINPLQALMKAMKKVAGGELDTQYQAKTHDEIAVLSEVFNHMTGDLKVSRLELEKTNLKLEESNAKLADTNVKLEESNSKLEETNRTLEEKVKQRTKQLEELAVRDTLTGLYNRRFFNGKLTEELNLSKRFKTPTSIIYLDIDHFKKYNDQNGHPMGDTLLKQFSEVMTKAVRVVDIVCRLGGEEFCIILPKTDLAGAKITAEKVRKAVESTPFLNREKQPLGFVSCSSGVAEFPSTATDEETLVQSADKALYHIKEGGRNAVGIAAPLADSSNSKAS